MTQISKVILLFITLMLMPSNVLAQGAAASVIVEKVKISQMADTTPLIARLVATVDAGVATRRNGVVDSVLFQVGDKVVKNQELLHLDDQLVIIQKENAKAALQSARSGISISKARVKLAENALNRQSGLKGSVAFSKARFEDLQQEAAQALGELSRAQAQVAIAQAAYERVKYDSKHSVIVAPFNGVVIKRNVQPGQFISLGGSIATLLDLGSLEIEADVPASLIQGLEVGRKLTAKLQDGTPVAATVRSVLPTENLSTRTRPVRLSVDLSGVKPNLIANGQTVTVNTPVSAVREVAIVPKDALVQGLKGGWMVFLAIDGKASPRPVTVGQANAGGLEILSGLKAGDYVVIRGNERLRPDQAIKPKDTLGNEILAAEPKKSAG